MVHQLALAIAQPSDLLARLAFVEVDDDNLTFVSLLLRPMLALFRTRAARGWRCHVGAPARGVTLESYSSGTFGSNLNGTALRASL